MKVIAIENFIDKKDGRITTRIKNEEFNVSNEEAESLVRQGLVVYGEVIEKEEQTIESEEKPKENGNRTNKTKRNKTIRK